MNAFVKKEVRLLTPYFAAACALALMNLLIPQSWLWHGGGGFVDLLLFLFSPFMALMLGLASFGSEMNSGTFATLLAQPVSRRKIWETKVALLGLALLGVGLVWGLSFYLRFTALVPPIHPGETVNDPSFSVVLFGLATFSGGLWTVLLLRQMAAAFWFTLLVPAMLLVLVTGLFADYSDEFREGLMATVLGVYCLAGFFFARWLFLRAQDLQWSGGTIVLPEIRGWGRSVPAVRTRRLWRPQAALWWKEIQLHQSQFIIAFVLLILHLGVLAVRKFHDLNDSRDLKFVLELFWGLWLVMPLLVGCTAVAEERKIGTHEGQLCLPVKPRTQWRIKISAVFGLSMIFGALMPLLLEGARILPAIHFPGFGLQPDAGSQMSLIQIFLFYCLGAVMFLLPLLTLLISVGLIGLISFYASTLARNTLQALAPAVLGLGLAWTLLMTAALPELTDHGLLWSGPLPYLMALPVLLLAATILTYWNFRLGRISAKTVGNNLLGLLSALALGTLLTTATYHRAWEKLGPFEPPHGPPKLTLANPARVDLKADNLTVRLPDGKVWLGWFAPPAFNPFNQLLDNIKVALSGGKFMAGSDWVQTGRCLSQMVSLKQNGTLWLSETAPKGVPPGQSNQAHWYRLDQFGEETNWSSFATFGAQVLLVKSDGTLWLWSTTNITGRRQYFRDLRDYLPRQLGIESNWARVYQEPYGGMFLYQTDGSVWSWAENWNTNGEVIRNLTPGMAIAMIGDSRLPQFHSTAQIIHGLGFKVGVATDGTFRIWGEERLARESRGEYTWCTTNLQIGADNHWAAVAGNGEKVVTLKNDGTLWLWNFQYDYNGPHRWSPDLFEQEVKAVRPTRLGTHADWIAISGGRGDVCTLAADGSLWYWPLEWHGNQNEAVYGGQPLPPLLDFSHKPRYLGNALLTSY